MSWLGQVGHVLVKDVRQNRWMIAITLLALAGAVAEAMGWTALSTSSLPVLARIARIGSPPPAVLLSVATVLLVAFIIQSDSASRSDAFWASRPLAPSAVLAAKVALAGVLVVLLPLLWEVVALRAQHLLAPRTIRLAAQSALDQMALVAVTAAVAALSRDVRTFLVAFLSSVIGWLLVVGVAQELFRGSYTGFAGSPMVFNLVAWTALGVVLVAAQYRVRDVRRTVKLFAGPAVAVALLSGALSTGWSSTVADTDSPPPGAVTQDVRLGAVQLTPPGLLGRYPGWLARVPLELVGGGGTLLYTLREVTLRVRLPDGSESRHEGHSTGVTLRGWTVADMARGWTPPGQELRWMGQELRWVGTDPEAHGKGRRMMAFSLPDAVAEGLSDPGTCVWLEGRMEVKRPVFLPAIALERDATVTWEGRHFRFVGFDTGLQRPILATTVESVDGSNSFFRPWLSFDAALVNLDRGEALALTEGGGGMSRHSLVLPGIGWSRHTTDLAPLPPPDGVWPGAPAVDDEWLKGAVLQIVDWKTLGTYTLSTSPAPPTVTVER